MVLAGAGLTGLRSLADRYGNSVTTEQLLAPDARGDRAGVTGPLNYLLIGSDLRASNPGAGQRADSIVIVHIPAGLNRAYLVSVPRDLLVQIPADPAAGYTGGTDRINAAFQFGNAGATGAKLLSATVTLLTGVRFDGAAILDFSGFRRVIDLIGGVQMCVDTEVRSIHTGHVFTTGCHQMDGARALDYVRQRYDLPNGDYDRQRHQQQLLKAVLQKVDLGDLVAQPVRLDQFIRAVGSSFTVDTSGVPVEDLAFALRGLRPEALLGVQMPTHAQDVAGSSYSMLDPAADSLFRALRQAQVPDWTTVNPAWVNRL
ncbi:LCP family protein [Polymorphospora rubra]|uniref:LCP family protein n=1 Tax=Polymorphospora rubra TaxID=338584 RepID=UPI001BB41769|nr:LCP family protein [Polymorphospora rubra]